MTALLSFENFSLAYGKKVVFDSLNLKVDSFNKIISLIGPDGSGKSTLLKIICGLVHGRGSFSLMEQNVTRCKGSFGLSIGYMSQSLNLYGELSVLENLKLFGRLKDAKGDCCDDFYDGILKKVGLYEFKDYAAASLSGGMRQKLSLICTMAGDPKILVLDEPTVGVDPYSRAQLWELIFSYIKEKDAICIFSSLYLEEAEHSDTTLLINEGQIIASGNAKKLSSMADGRCFSIQTHNTEYLKLSRFLSLGVHTGDIEFLDDALPRLGRIDIIVKAGEDESTLEKKLCTICSEHGFSTDIKIGRRKAVLEDAYILLTKSADAATDGTLFLKAFRSDKSKDGSSIGADSNTHSEHIVEVNNIVKRFGAFVAVKSSDFYVKKGEIFGLLGPNGAGKTTTFRMICALLNPSSGSILIDKVNLLTAKTQVRSRIGYVAQKFSLYTNLSTLDNLIYFGKSYGLYGSLLESRVDLLSSVFNLKPFFKTRTGELPFGVQRQLSMCCALLHSPAILFLDEATSGADPKARRSFFAVINALCSMGTSVIVTTHFMEEAEYCDRFLIQDKGSILLLGAPSEICTDAKGQRISVEQTFLDVVRKNREG